MSLGQPAGGGEIIDQFGMYYGADDLLKYASRRGGVSLKGIRKRVNGDIRGGHNPGRPEFRHTLQLNDCMVSPTLGGYRPAPGYRGHLHRLEALNQCLTPGCGSQPISANVPQSSSKNGALHYEAQGQRRYVKKSVGC